MCQQRMREQNRLSCLRVRLAWHDRLRMLASLLGNRLYQVADLQGNIADSIAHPHTKQRCYLVVAGTASPQATAHLWANDIDETAFHGAMDIFVARSRTEVARSNLGAELIQSGQHGLQVGIGKQTCTVQYLGVCLRR